MCWQSCSSLVLLALGPHIRRRITIGEACGNDFPNATPDLRAFPSSVPKRGSPAGGEMPLFQTSYDTAAPWCVEKDGNHRNRSVDRVLIHLRGITCESGKIRCNAARSAPQGRALGIMSAAPTKPPSVRRLRHYGDRSKTPPVKQPACPFDDNALDKLAAPDLPSHTRGRVGDADP